MEALLAMSTVTLVSFVIAAAALLGIALLIFLPLGKVHFSTPAGSGYEFADQLSKYADGRAVGNVFFVNSSNTNAGTTNGSGRSPDAPFSSIAACLAAGVLTNNNDDLILVMPGHTETITGAAGVNVQTAGLTIRAVPAGGNNPNMIGGNLRKAVVNYTTAAAASFDVNAANVTIDGLTFTPIGVANVTAAINVKAVDCTIMNCEFELANATNCAAIGILTTTAAKRLHVQNCDFHGVTGAGNTGTAITINGGTDHRIEGNYMMSPSATGTGLVNIITTATVNLVLYNNSIFNITAVSTKAFTDTITGSTGFFQGNVFGIKSGTAPFTAATMWSLLNNYAAAAATAVTAC